MNNQNQNNSITILDILSFYLALKNLDLNISQTDLQEQTNNLDKKVDDKVQFVLGEIRSDIADLHSHLELQDRKIDYLIELLEELKEK